MIQTDPTTEKTLSPYFFVQSDDPNTDQLPLKSTDVQVNIAGVIADVTVTQLYTNTGARTLEAVYIFPASTRAAVYGMTMTIGDRTIVAEIRERQQARQEYEEAKRAGKSASLLEQQRPNVFQMNVANILPGDEIRVELKYTELLIPTDGVYEFVYPTVVGPRYSNQPEAAAASSEQWVKNPYLHEGEAPTSSFDLRLNLAAGLPVQEMVCSSHKANINYEGKSLANLTLEASEKYGGNRDFILKYRLRGGQIESGLLLYQGAQENFFLLMVQPPERVPLAHIPPREYIFIVDVSGSMHGFPLKTAKTLLSDLIGNLRPTDLFNILLFSFGSGLLAKRSLPAAPENVKKGLELLQGQRGSGGTELLPALRRALELPREQGVSRSIVIVTDGYVSVEIEAFDLIRQHLGDANLFAFGIGSSVNRHLIEGMARVGMGEPFIVTKPDEAATEAAKLRKYIQTPVLIHIVLTFSEFETYEVEPGSIPDVLAERPVIVFGKWRGSPGGTISLRGLTGEQPYKQRIDVSSIVPNEANAALRYLWARHRIALAGDYQQLHADDTRVQEITRLGLTYNLLTDYTSFVAIDSAIRRTGEALDTVEQPLPLPQGVSDFAVGDEIPFNAMFLSGAVSAPMASPRAGRLSRLFSRKTVVPECEYLAEPQIEEELPFSEELEAEVPETGEQVSVLVKDLQVDGDLAPEIVENLLNAFLESDIEPLYRSMYIEDPQIIGKIEIMFIIAPSGHVKENRIVSSEVHKKTLERQVIKRLKQVRFPASEERGEVKVSCTFIFEGFTYETLQ